MKKYKILDLCKNKRKEEYQSKVGIDILFGCAEGKLTPAMRDSIAKVRVWV